MRDNMWYGKESSVHSYLELQQKMDKFREQMLSDSRALTAEDTRNMVAKARMMLNMTPLCMNPDDDSGDGYDPEQDPWSDAFRPGYLKLQKNPSGLAVIHVTGMLVPRHSFFHAFYADQVTSYEAIQDALNLMLEDDNCIGAVLNVHSGGGSACGMVECHDAIKRAAEQKPISGFTGTYAFSAGYGLLCAAKPVVAARTAEVGSIGTIMVHTSLKKMYEQMGVQHTVMRCGEFKALGLPEEELSEKAQKEMTEEMEKINNFFLEAVSTSRNVSMANRSEWGEGRTFFAEEALNRGLVDGTGTFEALFKNQMISYYLENTPE